MSKAKFSAAKELINEKRYDEARVILRTINHPTAREWLAKLDRIAPNLPPQSPMIPTPPTNPYPVNPPVSPHQERYYIRENRKARLHAIGDGIELIFAGIFTLVVFAFFAIPTTNLETGVKEIDPGLAWLLLPLALVMFIGGIRKIAGKLP